MQLMKKIYGTVRDFTEKIANDNIGAYSAEAAFFLIISIFPFAMLLITLLQYLPITENVLTVMAEGFLPDNISEFVTDMIEELSEKASTTIISVTALVTLWTASKGVFSVIRGINAACGVKETRGYIALRISALFYTLFFAVGILFTLLLLVFGNHIFLWLSARVLFLNKFAIVVGLRQLIGFLVLCIFFWFVYSFAPNRKTKLIRELPGAVFASLGWILFSFAFSFYINYIGNLSYFYGSLTSVIVLMLWLYICMYIVFIGAEINVFLKGNDIRKIFTSK